MNRAFRIRVCYALLWAAVLGTPRPSSAQTPVPVAPGAEQSAALDRIAEAYVRLALAVGQHDADYVDAYYGPEQWRAKAKEAKLSLPAIVEQASSLASAQAGTLMLRVEQIADPSNERRVGNLPHRHRYLLKHIEALVARAKMLQGVKYTFDDESRALYDAVAPPYPAARVEAALREIEKKLPPGEGSPVDRYERFRRQLLIPPDRLGAAVDAVMAEARRRTRLRIDLPAEEKVTVEYVKGKPWGAYAWYQGDYRTTIQINTDMPACVGDLVGLICHEGYPGHHVFSVLQEKHLARGRRWQEFTMLVLYSPQSLMAEGTAEAGAALAFPGQERLTFERDVLYPLAGLAPAGAAPFRDIRGLMDVLAYARIEATRRVLDGQADAETKKGTGPICRNGPRPTSGRCPALHKFDLSPFSSEQAAQWLTQNAMMSTAHARAALAFGTRYRSYIINYRVGQDLVNRRLDRGAGTAGDPQQRWDAFTQLLREPYVPSDLK